MTRVNTDLTSLMTSAIERTRGQENQALEQLASGRRVNTLSDDPTAAALAVENRIRLGETDQFLRNIADAGSLSRTIETALNEAVSSLTRAITLGVQGATDTMSAQDRSILATEIRGLKDRLIALGNTAVHGNYVFAGTAVDTTPFVADNAQASGVRYDGNTTTNAVQIAPGETITAQAAGSTIFTDPSADAFLALENLATELETGTGASIASATSSVRQAFDHVNTQRTILGTNLATLESAELFLQREKVDISLRQQDLVSADLAESASSLIQATDIREAILAAAGRISSLNLFDFLR